MNILYRTRASGLFGGLVQCGIQVLADVEFDHVCLKMQEFGNDWEFKKYLTQSHKDYQHIYDYVLDQSFDPSFMEYHSSNQTPRIYDGINNRIETSPNLSKYRNVLSKLKFKDSIIDSIWPCDFDKTLGVHIRMCMEYEYKYGAVTFDLYKQAIDAALALNNYEKLFIASDNHETIFRLEKAYPGMVSYYALFDRLPSEKPSRENTMVVAPKFLDRKMIEEAAIEALTLAKCDSLVCKTSNLGNFAIIAGNHKSIHRVPAVFGNKVMHAR